MKRVACLVIWLAITFFYVHVCVWVANNHPIYISVPVIWITMSIWACVWWFRFQTIIKEKQAIIDENYYEDLSTHEY